MRKNDFDNEEKRGKGVDMIEHKIQAIPIIASDDDTIEEVNIPEVLPILALRSSVLFPGGVTPITVGREKSIALIRSVHSDDGILGAVLQKDVAVENPTPDQLYRIGTVARILKVLEMPNGNLTVILSGLEKIRICTGYKLDGKHIDYVPSTIAQLERVEAEYIELDGWSEDITGVKHYEDLPANAKAYIAKVEELTRTEVAVVSVGPDREQTIIRKEIF